MVSFASSLACAFLLRSVLDQISKAFLHKTCGESNPKSLKQFSPGSFEFHIVRTGHFGLCQACGILLSIATYGSCPCGGWFAFATWALAMALLFSVPFGFVGFGISWFLNSMHEKKIRFLKHADSASSEYFRNIVNSQSSIDEICTPIVAHAVLKFLLAAIGSSFAVYGIAAINDNLQAVILIFLGGIFMQFARILSTSKFGRYAVVSMTNFFGASCGKRYILKKKIRKSLTRRKKCDVMWIIESEESFVSSDKDALYFVKRMVLSAFSFFTAKFEALSDQKMLASLRSRGKWKRSDSLKVYYEETTLHGFFFHVIIMIKHIIVGLIITSDPPLVDSVVKVIKQCTFT